MSRAPCSGDGLTDQVRIKIPPLTENGTELRIKERGLPKGSGNTFGHLYAVVRITIPESISKEDQLHWQELAANSSFNPRS